MQQGQRPITFCGQVVGAEQLSLVTEVSERYPNLSRTELANTVCELLGWYRANGRLKAVECRQWLERLQSRAMIQLPERRAGRPRGSRTRITHTTEGECATPLVSTLAEVQPVSIKRVETAHQRELWRELVERHHYLGHRVPFGAHLRYFIIMSEQEQPAVLGCMQFSSAAWRMRARDQWIGWDDARRGACLPHVVCNSRFLLLPWVHVKHLASHALALAVRALCRDWPVHYGVVPWLLETLVDPERFTGTCYRAANFIEVGQTTGRGHQDRYHQHHGAHPKTVFVYPLRRHARQRLCAP